MLENAKNANQKNLIEQEQNSNNDYETEYNLVTKKNHY